VRNQVTEEGIDLIQSFESCRLKAYDDGVGVWTIGWGTTKGVKRGMTITQEEADRLFEEDLDQFADGVEALVTTDINNNQFSALVSLAYNIGLRAFGRSTLLKRVNARNFAAAADQFLVWNKGGGKVMRGLTRRRQAERKLFLKPADDSPVLRVATASLETDSIQNEAASSPTLPLSEPVPTQTVQEGATGVQLNQPAPPIVSSPFAEPVKIAKGKSTDLLNYLMSASGIGSVIAFYKENPTLTIFFACIVVVAVLTVVIVVHLRKMKEAETKSDPTKYSIQFSNEVKAP
jgi:lysozyme